MNIQKRQSIQKLVIDQAGRERLILNDLILGFDGAQTVAQLIPQYHPNLNHLQIKGNNIDSQGFQLIFASLMNCPNLKSIQAQWNSIGTSSSGLEILCHLVRNLPYLQFIDLKNNRISHQLVQYICQIIELNSKSLKVIDLRWNELGEIGAQSIYRSLANNSNLKYIGLDDNRISIQTMNQIEIMMKNGTRGIQQLNTKSNVKQSVGGWLNLGQNNVQNIFPLSQNSYPSMELQGINAQLRAKIENQQNQTQIYHNKIKLEIDRTLQKIKAKGLQINQYQIKYDSLNTENVTLINQLRQAERLLTLQKERLMGTDKGLNSQKTILKTEKYNMNIKIQTLMEKTIQKNQREIQEFEGLMNQKMLKLEAYYRQRIGKKRSNRDKLAELKQDIIKLQITKENAWDKITQTYQNTNKNSLQQRCHVLQQFVAKAQFDLKSQTNRSTQLNQQLSSIVLHGLQKQQKMQTDIFSIQNSLKDLHNKMGTTNVQIQQNQMKSTLLESKTVDKQSGVDMRRKYIKYIHSQSGVNIEIQRLKQQQDMKGQRLLTENIEIRIAELQRAIRTQQTQNKMIRNQYDKLLSQIETIAKNTIQTVLYEM